MTYNDRAEAKLLKRKQVERGLRTDAAAVSELPVVRSNYLDLSMLQDYWSPRRLNHHTEMTSMLYALREGLRLVLEEGLEARHARHRFHEQALTAGLSAMGLALYGEAESKLTVVTCVLIPAGIDGNPSVPCCCSVSASRSPAPSGRYKARSGGSVPWASAAGRIMCCVCLARWRLCLSAMGMRYLPDRAFRQHLTYMSQK